MKSPAPTSRDYVPTPFAYRRRLARTVTIGDVKLGSDYPIRVQSMITSDTQDTLGTVSEMERLAHAGCEIIRVTVPTKADADNLPNIRAEMKKRGITMPVVADIHFTPSVAMMVVEHVEKVRINPGNFADKKKFRVFDFTDAEYQEEIERIREKFAPLVLKCKEYGRAMRIGVNHGSLSDRIMNRYGDTTHGMVESALEFARICEDLGFHNFVFSMKSSNPIVMIEAYRLLAKRLDTLGMHYPFHLGVTEAGNGEDGRIKSAIGIGALLEDGIGDTVRVSLTEDSEYEIPVAYDLVRKFNQAVNREPSSKSSPTLPWDPYHYERRASTEVKLGNLTIGGTAPIRVAAATATPDAPPPEMPPPPPVSDLASLADSKTPVFFDLNAASRATGLNWEAILEKSRHADNPNILFTLSNATLFDYRRLAALLKHYGISAPIHLFFDHTPGYSNALLGYAVMAGSLLCDGIGDSLDVGAAGLAYNILQASGLRIFKADFVSCPSCGRTQFDLQTTTARIKSKFGHLKGVKIAIMGCIVNGPGEMADAHFGYVGAGSKKIDLYVGKECVTRGIDESLADEKLKELIETHGAWVEPD